MQHLGHSSLPYLHTRFLLQFIFKIALIILSWCSESSVCSFHHSCCDSTMWWNYLDFLFQPPGWSYFKLYLHFFLCFFLFFVVVVFRQLALPSHKMFTRCITCDCVKRRSKNAKCKNGCQIEFHFSLLVNLWLKPNYGCIITVEIY